MTMSDSVTRTGDEISEVCFVTILITDLDRVLLLVEEAALSQSEA